jgi:hypothetical protein
MAAWLLPLQSGSVDRGPVAPFGRVSLFLVPCRVGEGDSLSLSLRATNSICYLNTTRASLVLGKNVSSFDLQAPQYSSNSLFGHHLHVWTL